MTEAKPFTCSVCGDRFGVTPRLGRWLAGGRSLGEWSMVCLCWVCTRLKASVDAEAKGLPQEAKLL